MALPPTDQELEQSMLSQAAAATGQGPAFQPLHPVDLGPKLPGSSYQGGYGVNGSYRNWQVDRMSTAARDTPDFAGSPSHFAGPPGAAYGTWAQSGQTSPWSLQQSPRSSGAREREDSPEWMPHFLGVEAVREAYQSYDASQMHANQPERFSWPAPQNPQRPGGPA